MAEQATGNRMHMGNVPLAITAVCLLLGAPLHAQEQSAADKQATPAATQEKPSFPKTSGAAAPLTIDQIRTNLPVTPAERFEFLRRQRKITLEAIDESSSQLKTLTASISLAESRKDSLETRERERFEPLRMSKERIQGELQREKNDLAQAKQRLEAARSKKGVPAEELARLESDVSKRGDYVDKIQDAFDSYDQRQKEEEKRKQDADAAMKAATEELSRLNAEKDKVAQSQLSYQRLLGEIDDMVNQLFISSDATNSFKFKMSAAFSGLVALVIGGFFWIAFSNEEVKKTIFSNEAGIQFITMFAIVIAVILFGIIGVLESKELSALLGGLSGYILGKSREKQA